jgi:hypothetical protein
MKIQLTILFVAMVFSLGVATASEVTGLTTFTSGTPAKASEVNDNFSAVKTAVDDNAANIATNAAEGVRFDELQEQIDALTTVVANLSLGSGSVLVLANSQSIGLLLDMESDSNVLRYSYMTRSSRGYIFRVYIFDGGFLPGPSEEGHLVAERRIYFSSPGCLGQAYYSALSMSFGLALWPENNVGPSDERVLVREGLVFRNPDSSAAVENYYIAKGAVIDDAALTMSAFEDGIGCVDGTTTIPAVPVLPNDPAITGVPNIPFALPITLGP